MALYTPAPILQSRRSLAESLLKSGGTPASQASQYSPLADLLSGVQGGLYQTAADKGETDNQALQSQTLQAAGQAPNNSALAQALIGSQIPDLQSTGLSALMKARDAEASAAREAAQRNSLTAYQKAQIDLERQKLANAASGAGDYSKQPVYGTDAQGNTVIMQLSPTGKATLSQLPAGIKVDPRLQMLDIGTGYVPTSKLTGQTFGPEIQKNLAQSEAQKAVGKGQGEAIVDLPKVEGAARRIIDQTDSVLKDTNLPNVTGWEGNLPTLLPKNVTTEEKVKQLSSGAFVQAFQDLKGGGAITEIEGEKATRALARLENMRQDDAGYVQALNDFKKEVVALVDLARRKAGSRNTVQPQQNKQPSQYEGFTLERLD